MEQETTKGIQEPKNPKKTQDAIELLSDSAGFKKGDIIKRNDENCHLCDRLVERGKAKKSTSKKK